MFDHKKKNLKAIYLSHTLDGFAMSLIGIFIPIYLLTLGFSVSQVISFFIVYYFAGLLGAFLAIYIARFIGLQRMLLVRAPLLFVFFGLLYILHLHDLPLYLIAAIGGVQNMFYWIPVNILFARNTEEKKIASDQGKMMVFPQIAGMFGPLLGGLIAGMLGFNILLMIVFVILCAAVIPLFLLKEGSGFSLSGVFSWVPQIMGIHVKKNSFTEGIIVKPDFRFEWRKGIALYRKYPGYFWAEVADNIGEEIEGVIWPVFVYLSLLNIEAVGLVGTLLSVGSIMFTVFIGSMSDKYEKKRIVRIGAAMLMSVWFLRYAFHGEFAIYLVTLISGFVTIIFIIPFSSLIFSIGKKDEKIIDEFFVFREIPVFLGRAVALFIALFLVHNITMLFPVAGIAYLYFLFF